MLEYGQTWRHLDGRTLSITMQLGEQSAIGEIWLASLSFGPMSMSMNVTEQGLIEAGFALDESALLPEEAV